jgi:polar amino acid transport system permease protein
VKLQSLYEYVSTAEFRSLTRQLLKYERYNIKKVVYMLDSIISFWPKIWFIIQGSAITLKYSVIAVFCGLCIGATLAIFKTSKYKSLRAFAEVYTSIFRGTPLLIQLMIAYNGIPMLLGIKITVFLAGSIAFSLNSGAYVSEIIRAGISAIDKGQFEATKVLGVSDKVAMRDIILPQALRKVLPALINELINLLKESSIISVLGEEDLMRRAQMISAESFTFFAPMITAAICYYILVTFFSRLARILERKLAYD